MSGWHLAWNSKLFYRSGRPCSFGRAVGCDLNFFVGLQKLLWARAHIMPLPVARRIWVCLGMVDHLDDMLTYFVRRRRVRRHDGTVKCSTGLTYAKSGPRTSAAPTSAHFSLPPLARICRPKPLLAPALFGAVSTLLKCYRLFTTRYSLLATRYSLLAPPHIFPCLTPNQSYIRYRNLF